jgi:hypothetical protein
MYWPIYYISREASNTNFTDLVWPERGLNPPYTTLEASILTITMCLLEVYLIKHNKIHRNIFILKSSAETDETKLNLPKYYCDKLGDFGTFIQQFI